MPIEDFPAPENFTQARSHLRLFTNSLKAAALIDGVLQKAEGLDEQVKVLEEKKKSSQEEIHSLTGKIESLKASLINISREEKAEQERQKNMKRDADVNHQNYLSALAKEREKYDDEFQAYTQRFDTTKKLLHQQIEDLQMQKEGLAEAIRTLRNAIPEV